MSEDLWVTLARVERPRGLRGELVALSFVDDPERLQQSSPVVLIGPEGPVHGGQTFAVEQVWVHQGRLVVKLAGLDRIEDVEPLRGFSIAIPRSRRLPAPEGSYHVSDLVGCRMEEQGTGRLVGVVEEFLETGGPGLLQVRTPQGEELLVPFARAVCELIETAARRIVVRLPEGLEDVNRR